ncbi:MAG: hypothetical protein V1870_04550 [Candidatus Aenigmatarchaeota archaeon]
MSERTIGKCLYCSEMLTKGGMSKHLQTCKSRDSFFESIMNKDDTNVVFLIQISGGRDYWLFLEINSFSILSDLDLFLRNIWLECCGHLSCFTINGIEYHSDKESVRDLGGVLMKAPLSRILNPGLVFEHEYDFGTTTHLLLKVIEARHGKLKAGIKLVSRNQAPIFECNLCKAKATEICDECKCEDRKYLFCKTCAKKHECGDEMLFPIVNSPRVGQCGYTGNDEDD